MGFVDLVRECGGYWGEHPLFPVADWQAEVAAGDTRVGYWDWVRAGLGLIEL